MGQNNYKKLFCAIFFIAFACISCWATAESLHLLLSTWPKIMCWVVTVGFFIIAAIGTKLIVDSLNTNVFVEKRGVKLIVGILIVIVFWLICSMPTNTHTFLYRTNIGNEVNTDISTTLYYLGQVKHNTKNENLAQEHIDTLNNKVDILLSELEAEIMNSAMPGDGPKADDIRRRLAQLLSVDKIDKLAYNGSTSVQSRKRLCDAYRSKILLLRDSRAKNIRNSMMRPNPKNLRNVANAEKTLIAMDNEIKSGKRDLNDSYDIEQVCLALNQGYNQIRENKEFINFQTKEDELKYTAPHPVSSTKRMISIIDLWSDFFKGKYAGNGIVFWIIVSILVDLAAFILFDIAFKKTDD